MSDQMMYSGYGAASGYLDNNPQQIDYNMPFTGGTSTYGMPITWGAFLQLLANFFVKVQGDPDVRNFFNGVYWVDFSKASLLRVLSQPGCEFVRFYFVIPESNQKISLMAEGRDANDNHINYSHLLAKATSGDLTTDPGDPGFEERGNGGGYSNPLRDLFKALEAANSPLITPELSAFLDTLTEPPAI
ncbi:MAG TPA: hypothetical protein VM802_07785 [Chitinophaga sp.]|uniref:hypothetical protein n=1 Tax=Chitinophaga sp. TaxID=1869181 RepID=UPI002B6B7603|nr:hypothetical protein [Chitinophaga sp.]HVI44754.1 hypothetical protein [Chitinophaga sp.]